VTVLHALRIAGGRARAHDVDPQVSQRQLGSCGLVDPKVPVGVLVVLDIPELVVVPEVAPMPELVVSERQNEGKVCNAGRLSARGGELYRRDLGA